MEMGLYTLQTNHTSCQCISLAWREPSLRDVNQVELIQIFKEVQVEQSIFFATSRKEKRRKWRSLSVASSGSRAVSLDRGL